MHRKYEALALIVFERNNDCTNDLTSRDWEAP